MAKQRKNVVTHGLSGKVGDLLIFRRTSTGTVVAKTPVVSDKVSDAQKAHRRKFQRAVIYGQAALVDLALREGYEAAAQRKKRRPFNVAVADFLHAPDIETIDVSGYHRQPGDVIRIEATDDFMVKEVWMVISDHEGNVVEEGNAQPGTLNYEWTYTSTADNPNPTGDRIEVYASDIPGNSSKAEETI